MKRMAYVLALTAGAGLGAGIGAAPAYAEKVFAPVPAGLQLSIHAASATQADAALALDVRFEGGTLRLIELQVDGVTVKKKSIATRTSHGHIEFQMEAGLLSEGTHDILVKALDADGNSATTSTQIKVMPAGSSLIKFQFPKNKSMVQGTVPIEIKLDASIHNPYVNFSVDDAFLSLTNYAPYTVNWDSTRVPNGLHTISVEVYDADTLAKIKSTSLQLNVNNPGGLTTRLKDIADLGHAPATAPAKTVVDGVKEAVEQNALNVVTGTRLDPVSPASPMSRLSDTSRRNSDFAPASTKSLSPLAPANRVTQLLPAPSLNAMPRANVETRALANADRSSAAAQPRVSAVKPGLLGLFASPRELNGLQTPVMPSYRLEHLSVRPRRAGNMAARPSMSMMMDMTGAQASKSAVSVETKPAATHVARHSSAPTVKPASVQIARVPQALRPMMGHGVVRGKAHSIQIAFDNTRIAFDVQPRVERGLPLAPFRQIFEHTGGTITWFNQSKTLRAVNSAREIELKVGEDEAKVNNQTVKMEAKSYIENGRTIVPLSFVRDALNVNVSYDTKTGHLRIDSKK